MCAVCAPQRKAQLYIALQLCNTQERKFTAAKKICAIYHLKSSPWELLVIKITKGGANLEFRISDKQAWAGANLDRSQSLFLIRSSGNRKTPSGITNIVKTLFEPPSPFYRIAGLDSLQPKPSCL